MNVFADKIFKLERKFAGISQSVQDWEIQLENRLELIAELHSKDSKLVYLETKSDFQLPESFEYPHFYRPTPPLAQEAARDLQKRLQMELPELESLPKGRMLGVLVVQTKEGAYGYLSAYSGELQAELEVMAFVPPVFQLPKGSDFPEMARINAISREINDMEPVKPIMLLVMSSNKLLRKPRKIFKQLKEWPKKRKQNGIG